MDLNGEKEYKKMSPKEKEAFLDDKINRVETLNYFFFHQLNQNQRNKYVDYRVQTADWLEDYEFEHLSNNEKQRYIYRKRYLSKKEFMRLNEPLKKYYIQNAAYTSIDLGDDEFESLSDNLKRSFINFSFELPIEIDLKRSKYLSKKNQKKFVDKCIARGRSFSEEECKIISTFMKDYYRKEKHKQLCEVRIVIRKILNEQL
jgi:hypothetical protein